MYSGKNYYSVLGLWLIASIGEQCVTECCLWLAGCWRPRPSLYPRAGFGLAPQNEIIIIFHYVLVISLAV